MSSKVSAGKLGYYWRLLIDLPRIKQKNLMLQEAVSRYQSNWEKEDISQQINEEFNLSNVDIGPPIAKGCAAVVYAATLKKDVPINDEPLKVQSTKTTAPLTPRNEMMSPIQYTSRFLHNFGGSVDNLSFNRPNVDNELVTAKHETNAETNSSNESNNVRGVKSVRFNTASNVVHSKSDDSSSSDEHSFVEVCLSRSQTNN